MVTDEELRFFKEPRGEMPSVNLPASGTILYWVALVELSAENKIHSEVRPSVPTDIHGGRWESGPKFISSEHKSVAIHPGTDDARM